MRALYETGLFQDVRINQAGGRLVVTVIENPVISRVLFEGNKKVKDEQLSTEVQSKPRGSLSRPIVQSDTQRITEIYRRQGRYDVTVVPQIIEQPNNRVDLVFEITEGGKTGVKSIEFVGNSAVSSYRLRDIIKTRETNILSFLGSADIYDADRVEADRDLIRRYYLKNGYADVQVVAALTEYDPERRGFLVTFKIEEGQQYRVASIDIQSNIRGLDPNAFRPFLRLGVGLRLQWRSDREVGRGDHRRGVAARLCLRERASARRAQLPERNGLDRSGDRGRTARLCRAHQRSRQHAHQGLRDPARIRYRRGRCVQPRTDRSRRAAAEESRLLQDREDPDRAGLIGGSRHRRRRSRREVDG